MGVAPVSPAVPHTLRAAVTEGGGRAFGNGLHASAAVTGVLCQLGTALAAAGLRGAAASGAE
jgi:hypothetical protein